MGVSDKWGVEISGEGNVTVVSYKAATVSNVEEILAISKQISEFIEANHPSRIIVDFEKVKFFSSMVLGLLLDMRAKLKACNGEVVVSAINPQLYRVFKITNLDKVFRFFPDRESAVEAMSTG
ncbi:MAG: STAS domain-containing protein [Planctomycetota bacterium]|nr:MAG: STAS domain-containing protein [Planctomycetota bacterium]